MDSEGPPVERKRMRPEDRRNAVLDAALRVFADAGFRRASLSEVGDEAGVTKGCLYHYFDSKEQLLLALMRERTHSLGENCEAHGVDSREAALTLMVRSLWRRYEKQGQLELTTIALTELPHAPEVARVLFDEVVTRNRALLRDTLQQTSGTQPPVVNDDMTAMLVPYMIMGAALGYRLYRDVDPTKRTSEEIEDALLSILLNGLMEAPER